jgi:hypothetical protein
MPELPCLVRLQGELALSDYFCGEQHAASFMLLKTQTSMIAGNATSYNGWQKRTHICCFPTHTRGQPL